jgi:hypothetical protein
MILQSLLQPWKAFKPCYKSNITFLMISFSLNIEEQNEQYNLSGLVS